MNHLILIESQGDDTVCAKNSTEFNEYCDLIFAKTTLNNNAISLLTNPKQIPDDFKSGDFFIIRETISKDKTDLQLGWKTNVILHSVYEKETGWIRSAKVKRGKVLKTITGTCIDLFNTTNSKLDKNVIDLNFAELLVKTGAPRNWKTDKVAQNFVEKMCTIDEITKKEYVDYVKLKLFETERVTSRADKVKGAIDIFKKLSDPQGMKFVYHHWRFHNTCREKLIHFYYIDKCEEVAPYFEKIFGQPISLV